MNDHFAHPLAQRDAYGAFCSAVLFPLHERLKGHDSVAVRRRLEAQERWPAGVLEAWRVSRLREFLRAVGNRVPYYRDLFACLGFDPGRVCRVTDLQRLPFADKATLRAAGDRLVAEGARGLVRYNTGGSSGNPLIFYIGKERKSHDVGAKWRSMRWWGVDIGDREAVVWGSPIELGAQDRLRRWRDRLLRSELLPAFEMSPGILDGHIRRLHDFRPAMVFGYPSCLSFIASHALSRGIALHNLGVRVAFTTAEPLDSRQRELIGEAFGCPVVNIYGARDAGFIAQECPAGNMHIQAEDIIVEIVDGAGRVLGPGEAGEIVVTHTATRDYPFLRYRTGDVGVLGKEGCSCGRTLPLLKRLEGRLTDFLVAGDGRAISGIAFMYAIRGVPGVERYKFIQHDRRDTELLVVASADFGPAEEGRLVAECQARLGPGAVLRVSRVADIPPEKNGKYRYVISHVPRRDPGSALSPLFLDECHD